MNFKSIRGVLRTEAVIVAANGLLSAVEDALEFRKRIVKRTTYHLGPPTTELQPSPTSPVKVSVLTPSSDKRSLMVVLMLLALVVLLQHWRLWSELLHEELPPPGVGAATAARAQAEVTMSASLENIARVKSK